MRYGEAWEKGCGEAYAAVQASGTRDVAQLIRELHAADTPLLREFAATIVREANRTLGGRAALALLRDEGGPDLLVDIVQFAVDAPGFIVTPHTSLNSARITQEMLGGELVARLNCGPWSPVVNEETAALLAQHRGS